MQPDEQIFHVWKKEARSGARNKFEGSRVCTILNAKLENWDFIWQGAFEQKDGMPRKLRLRSKFLVIVIDSIIQSGCLSILGSYSKESLGGRLCWLRTTHPYLTIKTAETLNLEWNKLLAWLRSPLQKQKIKPKGHQTGT